MIWVTDADGPLIYISEEWSLLTGQPMVEAYGNGWLDKVVKDDQAVVSTLISESRNNKRPYIAEFRVLRPDNKTTWVVSKATPSILPDGTFLGFMGVMALAGAKASPAAAGGWIGTRRRPPKGMENKRVNVIESLADQLIAAHDMADVADEKVLVSILSIALYEVGRRLAQQQPAHGSQKRHVRKQNQS